MHITLTSPQRRSRIGSVLLLPLCLYALFAGPGPDVLETAYVMLQEGGRLALAFAGGTASGLGGALLPLLAPLALMLFFYLYDYGFGVQMYLFWLGQNLLFTSHLVDSRNVFSPGQSLQELLLHADLLAYTPFLAGVLFVCGALTFAAALTLPWWMRSR